MITVLRVCSLLVIVRGLLFPQGSTRVVADVADPEPIILQSTSTPASTTTSETTLAGSFQASTYRSIPPTPSFPLHNQQRAAVHSHDLGHGVGPPPTAGPSLNILRPQLSSSPASTNAIAINASINQRSIKSGEQEGLWIVQTIERIGDLCPICLLEDRTSQAKHSPQNCYRIYGKCLACLDPEHTVADTGRACVIRYKSVCYGCGLPKKLYGVEVHALPFGKHCGHILQDKLQPFSFFLYRSPTWKPRMEHFCGRTWQSAHEFNEWIALLHSITNRVCNALFLMAWALNAPVSGDEPRQ